MRSSLSTLLALAGFLLLHSVPPLSAQESGVDVSGHWELTWETPGGSTTVKVTLEQQGQDVSGSAALRFGPAPVTQGLLRGNEVTFVLLAGRGERAFEMRFTGTVDGDAMRGTMTGPRGRQVPFEGRRVKG